MTTQLITNKQNNGTPTTMTGSVTSESNYDIHLDYDFNHKVCTGRSVNLMIFGFIWTWLILTLSIWTSGLLGCSLVSYVNLSGLITACHSVKVTHTGWICKLVRQLVRHLVLYLTVIAKLIGYCLKPLYNHYKRLLPLILLCLLISSTVESQLFSG